MNAPIRIDLVTREIAQIADELRNLCVDDERLFVDMLTGESSIEEVMRALLNQLETEQGKHEALTVQMAERKARRDFCDRRIEKIRDGMSRVLQAASLRTLSLPEATISIRKVDPKVVYPDVEKVPDDYCRFDRKLDRDALKALALAPDNLPSWATMDNGGSTLSIRKA